VSALDFSKQVYFGKYTDDRNRHYNVQLSLCGELADDSGSDSYETGPFDAWDTYRSATDRNISTKIVAQDFNLTIGSLNSAKTATEMKPTGIKAYYRLINTDTNTSLGSYQPFDANASASITTPVFNVASASKHMKVEFKYCADYNGSHYLLKPDTLCTPDIVDIAECSSLTLITSNNPCYRKIYSSDGFAIRPKAFTVGTNLPSGTIVKAGQAFEMFYGGIDWNGNEAAHYNESAGSTFDVNVTEQKSGCIVGAFAPDIKTGWQFVDGNKTIATQYAEVGVIDVNVTEYTKPVTSRFAAVDADDTDESNLTIESASATLSFIPDRFELAWDFRNANGGNFTYYENNATSMGGRLDLNVTAVAADGNATANYRAACYAQNSVATLAMGYSNLSDPIRPRWMDDGNTSHTGPSTLTTRPATMDIGIGAEEFEDADVLAHGRTFQHFSINFERNETVPLLPNTLTISNIDVNDTNGTFGALAQNQNAYYVYGRLFPRDARVFGTGASASSGAAYEVYGSPSIGATPLPRSRFDGMWYTNVLHDDTMDGDAMVTQRQSNGAASAALTPAVSDGAEKGAEVYDFTALGLPIGGYKAHVETDPWLWYGPNALGYVDPATGNTAADCLHHPCFNITVVPAVGASGSARSGSEDVKQRKKSDQGSEWRSTSDYAPAI
jgi:hypothetical protein